MWKRLDEQISLSEKWAKLSWQALGILVYVLPNTDSKGRYIADAKIIKARCMTYREDVRLAEIEDALLELQRERVLHLYDVNGKRYLVIHDHAEWNPPGALRYAEAKYPEPSVEVCDCLRRESGEKTPLVRPSSSSSSSSEGCGEGRSSPMGMLISKAQAQSIIGKPETMRTYFQGWIKRTDYTRAEQIVMDPWSQGKTLVEIHDHNFPKEKALTVAPKLSEEEARRKYGIDNFISGFKG